MGKMHNFDKENENYDDNNIETNVEYYDFYQNGTAEKIGNCMLCKKTLYEIDYYYINKKHKYYVCCSCYEKYFLD